MRRLDKLFCVLAALAAALALSSCRSHSDGGGGGPVQTSNTYSAALTSVEIVRSADALDMPVTGLPSPGAELTVH